MKVFSKFFSAVLALSLVVASWQPAYAGHGCTGCNVVDERVFNQSLVGTTVYVVGKQYTVTSLDYVNERVNMVDYIGKPYYAAARQTYTPASENERTGVKVVGTVVVGALLYCALSGNCGGNKSSSSSGSYSQSPEARRSQCLARCDNTNFFVPNDPYGNGAAAGRANCRNRCYGD